MVARSLTGLWREVIERRLKARQLNCELIFHRKGKPIGDFRKRWRRACQEAGSKGVSCMTSAAQRFGIWCAPVSIPRDRYENQRPQNTPSARAL